MRFKIIILLSLLSFATKAQIATNLLRLVPRDTVTNAPTFPAYAPAGLYLNSATGRITFKDASGYHKLGTGTGGGGGGGTIAWGAITGTLSSQTDLAVALGLKANIASPTFTTMITTPLIKITGGSPGAGKLLQSDADGDAVWFTPSYYIVGGALGTPSSGTGTNLTGIPMLTGLTTFSSSDLANRLTDETGTGVNVMATAPSIVNANLNTPSAINLANGTGLPIAGTTGNIPVSRLNSGSGATASSFWAGDGAWRELVVMEANTTFSSSHTLGLSDISSYSNSGIIRLTAAGPIDILVPSNGTVVFPYGTSPTKIALNNQGSDTVTVTWAPGVTHNDGGYVKIAPHSSALLIKVAINTWDLLGTSPGGSGGGGGGISECLMQNGTFSSAKTISLSDVSICNNSGFLRFTGTSNTNLTVPLFATESFEVGSSIAISNQSVDDVITVIFTLGVGGGGHTYATIDPGQTAVLYNAANDVWDLLGTTPTAGTSSTWTSWTPTYTGFTGSVTGTAKYKQDGKTLSIIMNVTGTSNTAGTTWTFTLPTGINASSVQVLLGQGVNNAGGVTGMVVSAASSNIITVYNGVVPAAWVASGQKGVRFNGFLEIN